MNKPKEENQEYLTDQIMYYLGNKRKLLNEIKKEVIIVQKDLKKKKMVCLDLFSGSGVVSRLLKQYSSKIIANDLEPYSKVVNECFLSNESEFNIDLFKKYLNLINKKINKKPITNGLIRKNYSPKNDKKIKKNDRTFYTNENAVYIDSFRHYIDEVIPKKYKKLKNIFLALLITEASVHVNTCGVFKGFYKDKDTKIGKFGGKAENALLRITNVIKIQTPPLQ